MLCPPRHKRSRRMLMCETCAAEHRRLVLGRVTTLKTGQQVLHVHHGHGTMVTDTATRNEWLIVCTHGHATVFRGIEVIWNWNQDRIAA